MAQLVFMDSLRKAEWELLFVILFQSWSHVPDRVAVSDWTVLHRARAASVWFLEEFPRQVKEVYRIIN